MRSNMLGFSQYLVEVKMEGSIGTEKKGLRHVINYVMPYLSKTERKHVLRNFAGHIDPSKVADGHGELHNPDSSASTHVLAAAANGHEPGTPVRVTGARTDDRGRIFVQTASHGEMPMSKLHKPEELKKDVITQGGFDVENKLAKNLGTQAAGSTGSAWDYHYRGPEGGIVGKARKIETDKPFLRGESKQNRAKMGESAVKYDPKSKSWSFAHEKLGKVFATAIHPKSKLPILEHLNKYHRNGVVDKGFTIEAPKGMTRAYLDNLGVNSLHLHRTEKAGVKKQAIDHGTTFTIGDDNEHAGKTNLGHLSNDDIDKLDGKLTVEVGGAGTLKMSHKPNVTTFKQYADRSVTDPEHHADLTREDHANTFKQHIDRILGAPETTPQQAAATSSFAAAALARRPHRQKGVQRVPQTDSPMASAPTPGLNPETDHGGRQFYSPQEKALMRGL